MRPQLMLRARGPLAVGALGFATLAAGASTAAEADTTGGATTQTTQTTQTTPTASIAVASKPRAHVLVGRSVRTRGVLQPAQAGTRVALQARRGKRWVTLDRAMSTTGGRYRLRYRTRRAGSWPLRVSFAGTHRRLGRVSVYRHAYASWYGPGLFGGHLAC